MKTHDGAKFLIQLANILKSSPNVEIESFILKGKSKSDEMSTDEIALNIHTLSALSRIKKNRWVEFIKECGWDVAIEHRDSSRNLIGRILTYLESNPDAMEQLKNKTKDNKGKASIELLDALASLLDKER